MNKRWLAVLALVVLIGTVAAEDTLIGKVSDIPTETAKEMDNKFVNYAADTTDAFFGLNAWFLRNNPTVEEYEDINTFLIGIIGSLFTLILMYLGMKWMLKANSVTDRNRIKEDAQKAIMLIVLVAISGYLISTIIEIEEDIVLVAVSVFVPEEGFDYQSIGILLNDASSAWGGEAPREIFTDNPTLSLFYSASLAFSGFTLFARHVIVSVCVMMFPALLFLLYVPIDFMKKLGNAMLKIMGVAIFLPLVDSSIIIATYRLLGGMTQTQTALLLLSMGFLMIGLFNVVVPYVVLMMSSERITSVSQSFTRYTGKISGA